MQAKLAAKLSPTHDASAIGYHIDNADGTEYAAFTQEDVSLLYSGYWDVDGLVTLPDTGGTVHWGTSGTDIDSVPFGPAEATAAQVSALNNLSAAEIAAALSGTKTITPVSNVVGVGPVEVYRGDTWDRTVTVSGVTLTDYGAVGFVAKQRTGRTDAESILYVRSDTGLQTIGGAEPLASTGGTLTVNSDTQFTILISKAETGGVTPISNAIWWLVGFDTTPSPAQKLHRATGTFTVLDYGLRDTA